MSENPIQAILKTFDSFAHGVQAHLSHLFSASPNDLQTSSSSSIRSRVPKPLKTPDESAILQSAEDVSGPASLAKKKSVTPLTKEELGRATWTLLHSIAAQPRHRNSGSSGVVVRVPLRTKRELNLGDVPFTVSLRSSVRCILHYNSVNGTFGNSFCINKIVETEM
ncbi:FAD-linked sulfhydryl oxidase ERV1-like isoform X2 [Phoenix dactylifera]|uniref:FAD-linked sulfhydryl oxidase ERV1-like isoform X2 n=1 Tax=Phoenix dactylifera TaxID=42345 RepID=A0A8B8J3X6_PHODC|nr:FAD-linked sulfhydryl oxidase ERV1-like isoform X2 [Phoenix dactylifera]